MIEKLRDLDIGKIKIDEPMSRHTYMKIGGPADIFIEVKDKKSLLKLISFLKNENKDYFILGGGANLLVSDKGIRSIVIDIKPALKFKEIDGNKIKIGAGNTIIEASRFALENSLSGMEALSGIPGTVGGGVYMNAGAYGSEFSDIVSQVQVINEDLQLETLDKKDMEFGYRTSIIYKKDFIVTSVVLEMEEKSKDQILDLTNEYKRRRTQSQPLNYPSAGSTFKRPEGYYAAALIEEVGLKGMIHKGVRVSDKHSGFIVNHNNGSFNDWLELVNLIKKEVYDYCGVVLDLENKILGEI